MVDVTPLTPNSLFFLSMMSAFIVAAFLHPQEFACVLPLPVYMMLIPSMYLLLTVYSVTNMHIVSWGTREVKTKLSAKELAQQKADEEEEAKKTAKEGKTNAINRFLHMLSNRATGMVNCSCCSLKSDAEDKVVISNLQLEIAEMKDLMIQMQQDMRQTLGLPAVISKQPEAKPEVPTKSEKVQQRASLSVDTNLARSVSATSSTGSRSSADLPRWIESDAKLVTFPRRKLASKEKAFWVEMIDKYLTPLDENKAERERIHSNLVDLRNKMVFAFGFINVVLALFVFIMQLHSDVFRFEMTLGHANKKVRMDPIGSVLVVFFGAILLVQCVGMLVHRLGTLSHLVAYTSLSSHVKKGTKKAKKTYLDGVNYVKQVLRGENVAKAEEEGSEAEEDGRTDEEHQYANMDRHQRTKSVKLDDIFENNLKRVQGNVDVARLISSHCICFFPQKIHSSCPSIIAKTLCA